MTSFVEENRIYIQDLLRESGWLEDTVLLFILMLIGYVIWNVLKVLILFYQLVFQPLNRIMPLGKIGYINFENLDLSEEEVMKKARRRRKIDVDLPPVYPNGWYRVMESCDLKRGEVKQHRFVGENLVLFRNESDVVSLMDTYCPHMGANIAVGGRVLGDCVQCPFHGWKFDSNGNCVEIPYSKTKLDFIPTLKTWIVREVNGQIMTWYHVDGESPHWEIPIARGLSKMKYCGRSEHHVNCHLHDIPENGYDEPHLRHLHLPFFMSGADVRTQFDACFSSMIHNEMNTDYADMFKEQKHIAKIHLKHEFCLWNKFNFLPVDMNILQIGPGAVQLYVKFALGEAIVQQYISPTDKLDSIFVHTFHISSHLPIVIGKLLMYAIAIQVERDIMVWNNRSYIQKPILMKEEHIQKKFNKWMTQFYSPNSIRYKHDEEE